MTQPNLAEAITITSYAKLELTQDREATNSIYKGEPVPHHEPLAIWLRENKKFVQDNDGTWTVSRTNLYEAIAALANGPAL